MHFDYTKKDDRVLYKISIPAIKAYANANYRITCYGQENIPKKKRRLILACNHISFTDPVVIISNFPYSVHFIAKSELFEKRLMAFLMSNFNAFPVRRGMSDRSAIRYACDILNQDKILGIFPEGRRVRSAIPEKARRGVAFIAKRTGADVLPASLYIDVSEDVFRPKLTLRFGKVLKNTELFRQAQSLDEVSDKIMNEIEKLWGLGHSGNQSG